MPQAEVGGKRPPLDRGSDLVKRRGLRAGPLRAVRLVVILVPLGTRLTRHIQRGGTRRKRTKAVVVPKVCRNKAGGVYLGALVVVLPVATPPKVVH